MSVVQKKLSRTFNDFFDSEKSSGILLIVCTIVSLIFTNSMIGAKYLSLWQMSIGGLSIEHWINDGLMAIFFLLIGLELRRELYNGELSNFKNALLPFFAAIGGIVLPALIHFALNNGTGAQAGIGIPMATDIAFALGVLALLGRRVPASLKIFLTALAVIDDLGAIIVIAVFYTAKLDVTYFALALIPLAGLLLHNRLRAHRIAPIVLLGGMLWVLVLQSGVHATLAGVITAFFVPLKDRFGKSPLHALERGLEPYVKFLIVPLFAFGNAGVVLAGMTIGDLAAPLPSGIALGLLIGKLTGVFGFTWLLVKSGAARLPEGANWLHIFGVSALAGIGFTMSLFIGSLSFSDLAHMNAVRLGVLTGSILSACLGFAVLFAAGPDRT